jgi:Protein of unknown function (DUF3999)
MKTLFAVLAFVFALADTQPKPAIPYFSNVREIAVKNPDAQNYVVVDNAIWLYARRDLGDLRLYNGRGEMPYALTTERGSSRVTESPAKLLNLGTVQGTTQFVLDTTGVPEYDQVTLHLSQDARDFITRANIEGADDLKASRWTDLGSHPLYDFSREKLGANVIVKLPLSRFRYLRFILPELVPEQINSATLATTNEEKARWTDLRVFNQKIDNIGSRTIITWTMEGNAPVERLQFAISPYEVNFRRPVDVMALSTMEDGHKQEILVQSGTISRIHFQRKGKIVDSEELTIPLDSQASSFKLIIENGDDLPLRIAKVQPQGYERRVYFDPRGAATLNLYYGDPKLTEPVYDYGKLFTRDTNAAAAEFGPPRANPEYTQRPDERPWSERHGWVTWAALIVAIVGLAVLTLRGIKSENAKGAAAR